MTEGDVCCTNIESYPMISDYTPVSSHQAPGTSDTQTDRQRNMWKNLLHQRTVLVDLLAIIFGIASWISINGLWVELPLLVQTLPEGWALPSYLAIIIQAANIGPITYGLTRTWCKTPPSQHCVITLLLTLGCVASLTLTLAWDWKGNLGGESHSVGLFLCVFCLSLVDCTSSVLFLPYMGLFRQIYLNSYLIGEGMSGFIPSIAALVQGVSGNPVCTNITLDNGTVVIQPITGQPRLSTATFFAFLFVMMMLSLVAFLMLQHLSLAKEERISCSPTSSHARFSEVVQEPVEEQTDNTDIESLPSLPQYSCGLLLAIQVSVCFLSNGALPAIQSYSCLPYGNLVYHLAVTLNAMSSPLMAFLAFFLPCRRESVVVILTILATGLSSFILVTALASPGLVHGVKIGGSLVVITWVLTGAMFAYVKVSVAGMCRDSGWLFQCGIVTQVGSALGALLMFLLVNQMDLFQGYTVTCPQ